MKVYLDLDGQKHYGYDLLSDIDYSNSANGCTALLSYPTYCRLAENQIDKLLDDNYVLKPGSEIHVVPKCPVAMDDIRKNYKVKRDVDTGECNVFSPYQSRSGRFWTYAFAVVPAKKIVVTVNQYDSKGNYRQAIKNLVNSYINAGLVGITDKVIYGNVHIDFYFERIPEAYLMLLEGKLQKPCISYKKLEFAHTNEMTMDILMLVYNTGNKSWTNDNVKNFQIQMQALNQYNWRDYKFTLSILFHEFLRGYGTSSFVFGKKSQQPKAIRELLEIGYSCDEAIKGISDKDYAMAKRLIESLMDMENVKFTTVKTLLKKLNDYKLRVETFNFIYDTAVRITPNRNIDTQND